MHARHLFASAAIAMAMAAPASAASVTIAVTNITGVFSSVMGGSFVGGEGTNIITWGRDPMAAQTPSSYEFHAATTPFDVTSPAPGSMLFDLGFFLHNNFPIIGGTGITGATLDFTYTVEVPKGGASVTRTSTAIFSHLETRNAANPCADTGEPPFVPGTIDENGCADVVTIISLALAAPETFTVGSFRVTLTDLGFTTGFNEAGVWLTRERASNESLIQARMDVNVIPLPAAGWMLLTALGGLGVAAHRRRRNAA